TRRLDPTGAPVFGTFQVQMPGGQGIIAGGANHDGDTDWTEVPICFQAPPDGRTRVSVFFVGFGKGTGTAWFDDLKLEEVDLARLPLKVTREFLCPGEISPYQYGQFVEYLCDLVPSMWAEKLYDGSFEGLSPYKFAYLKEQDFREKPWYPSGATNRAEISLDLQGPVSGQSSKKIAVVGGTRCTVGISQDGIAVDQGQACTFSCFLRQEGIAGAITVRLHHEDDELARGEMPAGGQWQKAAIRLAPAHADSQATLSIEFQGPGTLWLDNASLMPDGTVGGWRRDVVDAVRALKPGVIRFGGSALDDLNLGDFEWKDTIGNPDRRKPFRAWGGLQPTGPGLEEIVQFCGHVGAEPLICVRVSNRQATDAADQVEYFNGAADTPLGKLRAANGRQGPYGIKFWQIGNERAGEEYEAKLREFAKAMRRVDPTIKLLASYPREGVLKSAGELLDYVAPHHYGCADLSAMENDLLAVERLILKHVPNRPIKIAVTEWNTTGGDWGPRRAMLWTLENALACARYHHLLHRHCDLVEMANRSNLINSFCSGIIQTDNHRLYKTPTYYAQQLYAVHAGNRPLKVESAISASVAPDLSATLSIDGASVSLFAVNDSALDVTRPVDLTAFGDQEEAIDVWTLADTTNAGEADAVNSFAEPQRIVPL
ncbi:MAG TPA: alpha-L-arabinofuranosidase C-terminal domain-containing protein, partial [Pirellulales bacterium]|nr:alpha-L-arabinofuranosidase C-terminal domain-containing protein [Pirellulales bacterium]